MVLADSFRFIKPTNAKPANVSGYFKKPNMNDNRYKLNIDLNSFNELDEFAHLACQDYNYSNTNNWFLDFRGGLFGFYQRMDGFAKHYFLVHEWIPVPRNDVEYHLSAIFFNMDSAIECLTYTLNAFGNAFSANEFYDISESNKLKKINPYNIIGKSTVLPLNGYLRFFPKLQSFWQNNQDLLSIVMNLHDVSKHRKTIYEGGMSRLDPPIGFYESLGITEEAHKFLYWPMAEIILSDNPKEPVFDKTTNTNKKSENSMLLEDLAPMFCDFINKSGQLIIEETRNNVHLNEVKLLK